MPSPKQESMKRRASLRRGSTSLIAPPPPSHDLPWDIFDRLFLPILSCHAVASILSFLIYLFRGTHVSTAGLFTWFALSTIGAVMFYHNLKITSTGKAILVTGCDSPLTWALAKKLDEMGFSVFAGFSNDIDNPDADMLKDECSARLKVLQVDVTNETQILEASLYVSENLPEGADGLWAIVHGATWVALGELEWVPFPVLRKSIEINLLGAARLTQIMLPLVRKAGGRIVFLSSALSRVPAPVRGAQCATQAGVEGLALCLRSELRPRGVDVSIVATGEFTAGNAWLNDDAMMDQAKQMWAQMSDEQKESYGEDYFETAIRSLEKYTHADPDYRPAVKSLVDAVIKTFPLARYTPVTKSEKVKSLIAEHLPTTIYDALYAK